MTGPVFYSDWCGVWDQECVLWGGVVMRLYFTNCLSMNWESLLDFLKSVAVGFAGVIVYNLFSRLLKKKSALTTGWRVAAAFGFTLLLFGAIFLCIELICR